MLMDTRVVLQRHVITGRDAFGDAQGSWSDIAAAMGAVTWDRPAENNDGGAQAAVIGAVVTMRHVQAFASAGGGDRLQFDGASWDIIGRPVVSRSRVQITVTRREDRGAV